MLRSAIASLDKCCALPCSPSRAFFLRTAALEPARRRPLRRGCIFIIIAGGSQNKFTTRCFCLHKTESLCGGFRRFCTVVNHRAFRIDSASTRATVSASAQLQVTTIARPTSGRTRLGRIIRDAPFRRCPDDTYPVFGQRDDLYPSGGRSGARRSEDGQVSDRTKSAIRELFFCKTVIN